MAGLLPDQLLAGPQQLAQFLDLLFRHKAAADQPVGQQVGNPSRIADIGLATRYILDMSGIGQDELEIAIAQNVPHRLPVYSGRLHGRMGAALLAQPRQQAQQPGRCRLETFNLARDLVARSQAHARHYRLLVNIKTGATRMNDLHQPSSLPSAPPAWGPYR